MPETLNNSNQTRPEANQLAISSMAEDLNSGPPNFKFNALTARSRYLLTTI